MKASDWKSTTTLADLHKACELIERMAREFGAAEIRFDADEEVSIFSSDETAPFACLTGLYDAMLQFIDITKEHTVKKST